MPSMPPTEGVMTPPDRPDSAWGTWLCPLCTAAIAVSPTMKDGLVEMRLHSDAHVEAADDYLLGLI